MRRLLAVLILLSGLVSASAQNHPLETTPEISLAFPMEETADGVRAKHTVLINDNTILPAKSTLRVIYIPPRTEDDRLRAVRSSHNAEAAWTRNNRLNDEDKLSPSEVARQKISRETNWPSITNFQLALANLGADDLRVVYIVGGATPDDFKFYDQRLVLPEGMLLAEVNGTVTVLAVEKTKPAERAGIKAGDILTKIGDRPVGGSLTAYLNDYHVIKKDAVMAMKTSFPISVKAHDGTERVATVKLPPSINSSFLDSPIIESSSKSSTNSSTTNTPSLTVPEVWEKKKPTQPAAPNP